MTSAVQHTKNSFRTVELLFWLLWIAYPLMIGMDVIETITGSDAQELLTPAQSECLQTLPIYKTFSTSSQITYWIIYALQTSLTAGMIYVVHMCIRGFAQGNMLVQKTLNTFRNLGALIMLWAVTETIAPNALMYMLALNHDVQKFVPSYMCEITGFAVGLFIFCCKFLVERAMALQAEADLTV